jgi:hypothetical protein
MPPTTPNRRSRAVSFCADDPAGRGVRRSGNLGRVRDHLGIASITFDEGRRRVTVEPWSVRAEWIRLPDCHDQTGRESLIRVRPKVNLLVRADDGATSARVELWSGHPGDSDGIAVAIDRDGPSALYRIPLCGCGERECGHVGLQLSNDFAVETLPALIDLLAGLPETPDRPTAAAAWDGEIGSSGPMV